MFQVVNPNTVYDIINESRIELFLSKDKSDYDVAKLLDDVSVWMDHNREYISEKYLPFGILSVGIIPIQVSAFLYGLFIGKALEKHNLKIRPVVSKADKKAILEELEQNQVDANQADEGKSEESNDTEE
jgi:hypothetical protein